MVVVVVARTRLFSKIGINGIAQLPYEAPAFLVFVEKGIQWTTVKGNPTRDKRRKQKFLFLRMVALVGKLTHEFHRLYQQFDIYRATLAQVTRETMEAEDDLQDDLVLSREHLDRGIFGHGRLR